MGALYSNFDSKEDLFLALYEERIGCRRRELREVMQRAGDPATGLAPASANVMQALDRIREAWRLGQRERRESTPARSEDGGVEPAWEEHVPTPDSLEDRLAGREAAELLASLPGRQARYSPSSPPATPTARSPSYQESCVFTTLW